MAASSKHRVVGKASARPAKRRPRAKTTGTARAPCGPHLGSASQSLRDTLIVQRRAQGWTWDAIAEEAGIGVRTAQEAAERKRKEVPLALKTDPLQVVEDTMLGFQTSIGDLEALAVRYQDVSPNAAIGAKRAANEARNNVLVLLQAVGRLPEDLVMLRNLIEQRAMATTMLDALERFEERMVGLAEEVPEDSRGELADAVTEVQATFNDLLGLQEGVGGVVDRAHRLPPTSS